MRQSNFRRRLRRWWWAARNFADEWVFIAALLCGWAMIIWLFLTHLT